MTDNKKIELEALITETVNDMTDAELVEAVVMEVCEKYPLSYDHAEDGRYTWPDRFAELQIRLKAALSAERGKG